jgi:hypothetical protein
VELTATRHLHVVGEREVVQQQEDVGDGRHDLDRAAAEKEELALQTPGQRDSFVKVCSSPFVVSSPRKDAEEGKEHR